MEKYEHYIAVLDALGEKIKAQGEKIAFQKAHIEYLEMKLREAEASGEKKGA